MKWPFEDEPAFPVALRDFQFDGTEVTRCQHTGMDLRDYFAAQTVVALVSHYGTEGMSVSKNHREIASESYALADAMIEARKK